MDPEHPAPDRSRGPGFDAMEWRSWDGVLRQFSHATQLVVSIYSADAKRELGPTLATAMTRFFEKSSLWSARGPGTDFEKGLAADCIAARDRVSARFMDVLRVDAIPMFVGDDVIAAITFGWVYPEYATGLGTERLARKLEMDGRALWGYARMQVPVPDARMDVYADLLTTIVSSGTELRRAIAELQRVQSIREVFLAHVSHELRTPLAAISMRIELLKAGGGPFEQHELLEAMAGNVADESRLIEDLIDVARSNTGQLTVDRREASLRAIVESAVDSVRPAASRKGHDFEVDMPPGALPILADEDRLRQVFWNILTNAIKFTPDAGRVRLGVRQSDGAYLVTISDSGVGISESELTTLFQSFTRRSSDNEIGLGVGLAIASHIVNAHGGRIEARSDGPGRGASFTISLPRSP